MAEDQPSNPNTASPRTGNGQTNRRGQSNQNRGQNAGAKNNNRSGGNRNNRSGGNRNNRSGGNRQSGNRNQNASRNNRPQNRSGDNRNRQSRSPQPNRAPASVVTPPTATDVVTAPSLWFVAVPILVIGVIVTAALFFVLGIIGLGIGVVLTALVSWWRVKTFSGGIEDSLLSAMSTRPAAENYEANLLNLVEGLSATAGVPVPKIHVVANPGANMCVLAVSPQTAAVVVTSGLVNALNRIELEAVVARALAAIRQGDAVLPTLRVKIRSTAFLGVFDGFLRSDEKDIEEAEVLADRAGVMVTRYPPAMISALESCMVVGTSLGEGGYDPSLLWMFQPNGGSNLHYRIEALRLL